MRMKQRGGKRVSRVRLFSLQSRKKGLSPVIATVLLVGMIVVIGMIIFMWFRGLTQEAVTKFDKNIQLVCDEVDFSASYDSGSKVLSVSNRGTIPIFDLKMKISDSGGNVKKIDMSDKIATWPEAGLNEGGAFSGDISSEFTGGDLELIPILKGTSQNGGQASYTCQESRYSYEVAV